MTELQDEYRNTYLKSTHWKKLREERMNIDNHECRLCGKKENLVVHHLSYDRLGNENVDCDLVTLCADCHSWIHAIKDTKGKEVKAMTKAYRNEARKAIEDIARKYRMLSGQHLARVAFEFLGTEYSKRVPTILRILRDTLEYDAGYCSVSAGSIRESTYTIAAQELKELRKGKQHD